MKPNPNNPLRNSLLQAAQHRRTQPRLSDWGQTLLGITIASAVCFLLPVLLNWPKK